MLLSLDVEAERDVSALEILNIEVPATYFVTGEFAEAHPDVVRDLARNGTVGSHSHTHPHLTQIGQQAAFEDLKRSRDTLERVLGEPPRWFRAPYLEIDENIANALHKLGFAYDSSDQERWPLDDAMGGLPISNAASGILASDYEFFAVQGFSDDEALFWLKSVFMQRMANERPFVLLLHPRLLAPHANVLKDFVAFANENGGVFLTFDDYVAQAAKARPVRTGFWVDLSLGQHNPDLVLQDALSMKATDVFLMAKDPEGNYYFADDVTPPESVRSEFEEIYGRLKSAGIRVHAWLPVNKDVALANQRADWAMISTDGAPSEQWMSPSHPEWRRHFLSKVKALLSQYDLDGIHLDYIRYPSLDYDFGPYALAATRSHIGDKAATISELQSTYYLQWVDWRYREIAALVRSIKEAIGLHSDTEIVLSAALIGDAAVSYSSAEFFGQDYSRLAEILDVVMPMAYFNESKKSLQWISNVVAGTRYLVGTRQVYVGLEAYQKPGSWSLDAQTFARSVDVARYGADGLVFYPYLHLFGRGDEDRRLPAKGLAGIAPAVGLSPGGGISPDNGGEEAVKRQTNQISGMTAVVIFIAAGSSFGAAIYCVYILRRRRERARGSDRLERDNHIMLPAPAGQALAVFPNWRTLEDEIKMRPIPPSACAIISSVISRYGSRDVEKNRLTAVLDACDRTGGSIADILSDLSVTREWNNLGIHYLHECGALDLIVIVDGIAELTAEGRTELEKAQSDGFDREIWEFVERRLHETLTATCPDCGAPNLAHWFWSDVECRNCESAFKLSNCNQMSLSNLEKISGNIQSSNLSALNPSN